MMACKGLDTIVKGTIEFPLWRSLDSPPLRLIGSVIAVSPNPMPAVIHTERRSLQEKPDTPSRRPPASPPKKKKKKEFYIPQVTCSISVDRCVKDRGSRENPLTHWNPSPSAVRYPRLFYLNATPYPLCRRNWLCYRLRWLPLWWVSACASWLRTKRFKYSLCWQRGPPWVESLWMAEGSRLKKWGALYMKSSVEMKYFDKNFHAKMQLPHFPSIFPNSLWAPLGETTYLRQGIT